MILAIDIGNTNIVFGLFDGEDLLGHVRLSTGDRLTSDEAGFRLTRFLSRVDVPVKQLTTVIVASVVPHLTGAFEEASRSYCKLEPVLVSPDLRLPIGIAIDRPEQIGADRIANAVAAYTRFGGPAIVVDFGTATNFDIVNAQGDYIGGVLLPGPRTSMADLARRAARLFDVRFEPPARVVGQSTEEALKSGLFYGTIGQVDSVLDRILEETGFEKPVVVGTGGLAAGIVPHSRHIERTEPTLTLDGLRIIGEMNRA